MKSMKSAELIGKPVIDNKAQILGKVCEIEFDTSSWKVINIHMDLEKMVAETMGFHKPRIGSCKVSIPVKDVNAISDVASLKKNAVELRGVARKI